MRTLVAWYCIYMNTRYCANPECGEAFDPTETANDYCSWDCEERHNEIQDEEN